MGVFCWLSIRTRVALFTLDIRVSVVWQGNEYKNDRGERLYIGERKKKEGRLNIISCEEYVSQDHNEIPLHTPYDYYNQKDRQ